MYILLKTFSRFSTWLGPSGWRFFGSGIGSLIWWFLPSARRKILLDNLTQSLQIDVTEARKLARENCRHMGIMVMETMASPKLKRQNISDWVTLEGKEHLDEALSYNKGALLVTGHIGNWEWLGGALALHGYPMIAVMTNQHNPGFNRMIIELRTGMDMIVNSRTDVRDMVRRLKDGKFIGLLMDQYAPQSTIKAEFFGRETTCQPGAAVLGRMQNAPIVPVFIHREANGKHRIMAHPVRFVSQEKEKDIALQEITQDLMTVIEAHIRAYPTEWFWLHNRWKTVGRARTTG